jgi:O-antigen ligase
MSTREPRAPRAWADRLFEGVESLGLVVLLAGLPVSEVAKSAGLFLAALGFIGRRLSGAPFPTRGRAPAVALAAYFLVAVASVLVQPAGARRPESLSSLALVLVAFPLVLDACTRPRRRTVLTVATLAGGAIAAVQGYAEYMSGSWLRLALPSIENAVPAAEYLGAVAALALAVLFVEWRAAIAGPSVAFVLGVSWLTLLMTKSRGPMVGAAAGAVAAVGLSLRKRHAAVLLVALALGAALFWRAHPEARVVDDVIVGSRAARSRAFTWRRTAELISERPVLGHGQGGYDGLGVVFEDEIGPIHQGNAHNTLLQVTVETGFLGCGAFLAFLVLGIRGAVRALRRASGRLDRAIVAGALAGVVAILVAGAFSVSTDAEPGILCYALLALAQPRGRSGRGTCPNRQRP